MPLRLLWATVLLFASAPVSAQEQISPEEFLNRVAGRTATFSDFSSGRLIGVEEFLSRKRSVWERSDGSCAFGTVYTKDQQICFLYDDQAQPIAHCWTPFALHDRLWVVGSQAGEVQEITEIADEKVSCDLSAQF